MNGASLASDKPGDKQLLGQRRGGLRCLSSIYNTVRLSYSTGIAASRGSPVASATDWLAAS
jgi:hypothetical protein